ncbi:hypothetical protein D3C80_906270 [compost metagenome]
MQDGRREDDLVIGRVVVGVDRLGRHAPLGLVHRLVQAVQLIVPLELTQTLGIAEQVVGADFQRRIVAPLVGVTDLDGELAQLLLSRRLGVRSHPGQVVDAVRQGGAQVGDQLFHLGLGFGRKVFGDIEATGRLA